VLRKNTGPVSRAAITRPATPGPMSRAALKDALLRPTALLSDSCGTISETKVWRAGLSSAAATPCTNASRKICQSWTAPVTTRTPVRSEVRAIALWVANRMRLLGKRSAIIPAIGAKSARGANCNPVTIPSATDEWGVSWVSTSQSCATRPIQVPVLEMSAPAAKTR
jgi:hypothetical protein